MTGLYLHAFVKHGGGEYVGQAQGHENKLASPDGAKNNPVGGGQEMR